jgi:hypothetical protein
MLIPGPTSSLSRRIATLYLCFQRLRFAVALLFLSTLLGNCGIVFAQKTINVPKDQATIQAGIDAAENGDTVLVAPGTYNESIDFMGKAITVMSSGGPTSTIIDGGARTYTVLFKTNEQRNSILNGFTVQNGGKVSNTLASYGGIGISSAAPSIVGNIITNNFCYNINSYTSSPLIQGNEISSALDSGDACSDAGGAAIWLLGNYQDSGFSEMPGAPAVIGNTIESNVDSGTEGAGSNGSAGIADWGADPIIENNIIRNNKTYGNGGGVNIVSGGALVAQNLIYGNQAGCGGGGLSFDFGTADEPGPVTGFVINNVIAGNTTFHACVFDGIGEGSQVYVWVQSSQTEFANNIIVGKSSDPAVFCDPTWDGTSFPLNIFDHNDVFNPGGAAFGGTCLDQNGAYGNISADPLFVNAAGNEYHLQAGSPAIDSGNNSALQQLDNNSAGLGYDFQSTSNERVQDATATGHPIVDMGVYESSGTLENGSTTIILTPSTYQALGGTLSLTAQLVSPQGPPSGTITFYQDQKQIGSGSLDSGGSATFPVPSLTPGVYDFIATYPGSVVFAPGISVKVIVLVGATTVSGNSTSTSLTSSLNPATSGQLVTFTATASASTGTPTGTMAFSDGTTALATEQVANGVAAYSTNSLRVGSHTITASFTGTGGYANGSASRNQVINGLASVTALMVTPPPTYVSASTLLTAAVSGAGGTPSGTVTFAANGTAIGTATLNAGGNATLTYAFPSAGAVSVTATYSGDATFSASTSTSQVNVLISPTTTTVLAVPNPAFAFQSTMLIVRVNPAKGASSNAVPSGAVTFYDGANNIGTGTLNADGSAAISSVAFQAGTHSITAAYAGNADFAASTSLAYSLVVNPDTTVTILSAAPNPAAFGAPVLFNAAVSALAIPSGTVTFYDGATAIGTASVDANGNASFTTSSLSVGTHPITASFGGSANFGASVSAVVDEVILGYVGNFSITVTPTSASIYTGESAKFTVAVTPTAGWNSNVTLSCGALPANTTCTFGATAIAGGSGSTSLVIQTAAPQHASADPGRHFPWLRGTGAGLALALLILPFRLRRSRLLWSLVLLAAIGGVSGMMSGCGAGPVTGGTSPGVYSVAVNGTYSAGGQAVLVQTAAIALTVKTLF